MAWAGVVISGGHFWSFLETISGLKAVIRERGPRVRQTWVCTLVLLGDYLKAC